MPGAKWGEGPARERVNVSELKKQLQQEAPPVRPEDESGFHNIAALKQELGLANPESESVDKTQMWNLEELRRLARDAAKSADSKE